MTKAEQRRRDKQATQLYVAAWIVRSYGGTDLAERIEAFSNGISVGEVEANG